MKHVVIIGNGVAGITAARHIRKRSDHAITVISAETDHFFSRTALMYIYMGHMKYEHTKPYEDWFWKKNSIDLVRDYVEHVDFDSKTLSLSNSQDIKYDTLILATGSKSNKFGWKGQDLKGVQGLYSYQDLQLLEQNTHPPLVSDKKKKVSRAVIVGGGLIGVELAEMLQTRDIEVTFLIREAVFWGNVLPPEEGDLLRRHMQKHHIDLRFETELDEILEDERGRCRAVRTKSGEEIECQLVGLTAGVSPNIDFLKDSGLKIEKGIVVDEQLRTNQPDVFAIGDCAQLANPPKGRRPIEAVWYVGRMMGETVARTICDQPVDYDPGPWFNSAKFFDIEYQTYGEVASTLPEGQSELYWEDGKDEVAMHFRWEKDSGVFVGINNFGIRLRHNLFDRWLKEGVQVDYVLEHLRDANFDPEFYKHYEKKILKAFNQQERKNIKPRKKSWKRILKLSAS